MWNYLKWITQSDSTTSHVRGWHEIPNLEEKKFFKVVYTRGQVSPGFFKRKKKVVAQSLSLLSFWVFVDTILIIIKVNITLVQVHVAIRNTRYFFDFTLVHVDLDYPIDFGP